MLSLHAGLVQEQTRQMPPDPESYGTDEQERGYEQHRKWKRRTRKELFESFVDAQAVRVGGVAWLASVSVSWSAEHRPQTYRGPSATPVVTHSHFTPRQLPSSSSSSSWSKRQQQQLSAATSADPQPTVAVTAAAAGRLRARLEPVQSLLEAFGQPRRSGHRLRRMFRPEGRGGRRCGRLRIVRGRAGQQRQQRRFVTDRLLHFTTFGSLLRQPGLTMQLHTIRYQWRH